MLKNIKLNKFWMNFWFFFSFLLVFLFLSFLFFNQCQFYHPRDWRGWLGCQSWKGGNLGRGGRHGMHLRHHCYATWDPRQAVEALSAASLESCQAAKEERRPTIMSSCDLTLHTFSRELNYTTFQLRIIRSGKLPSEVSVLSEVNDRTRTIFVY